MKFSRFTLFVMIALLLNACTFTVGNMEGVRGSGVSASEIRTVTGFTGVEIAGSAEVTVEFGDTESVVVETDDNLLPYIETKVSAGSLVIGTKPNTNLNTNLGIHAHVTMKSIEKARVTGSGNMTISGIQAETVKFDLPGSGNITATGTAKTVNITLPGSGNIYCDGIQSETVTAQLSGSGNITANASESIKASLVGSGNIRYRGNPVKVEQSVTGSGIISPLP